MIKRKQQLTGNKIESILNTIIRHIEEEEEQHDTLPYDSPDRFLFT